MSPAGRPTITNRRARHDFEILTRYEAGIELKGSEVKSVREGKVDLSGSYCRFRDGELFLIGATIAPYDKASTHESYDPHRPRKLLLHRRELNRLEQAVSQRGLTIVPLKMYFKGHLVKVEIALARGKKIYDKREAIKKREFERRASRIKAR